MQATFVDVQNELRDIKRESDHLVQLLSRLGQLPLPEDSQTAWEVAHVCGSAVEKIYTGLERVMARIASEVDKAPVTHTEFWHASLLKRMAKLFPGRSPCRDIRGPPPRLGPAAGLPAPRAQHLRG